MAETRPMLSIVLVTRDARSLAKVLRCYRATGDPDRLEIVVVGLKGVVAREAITTLGFRCVRTIDAGGDDLACAEERAVHAASAPYVVFGQIHSYPLAGFVDAILAAVRARPWTVVGPAMTNANPRSVVSWAAMQIHYGPWSPTRPRGLTASLPGHCSAYERSALLALGDELYFHLDAGPSLQEALRTRDATFFFEPSARIAMLNISRLGVFLRDQFLQGADFARQRRRDWHLLGRMLYVAGAPLIPAVRLVRVAADLRRDGRLGELVRGLPILLAGLAANAAGECFGYAASLRINRLRIEITLDRLRYVSVDDRLHELDESTWPVAAADSEVRS